MKRKSTWISIGAVALVLIALAPAARLLVDWARGLWGRPVLEVGQDRQIVTRYIYDSRSTVTNILEGREDRGRVLGKVADRQIRLDDYYAALVKEYRIDDSVGGSGWNPGPLSTENRAELGRVDTPTTAKSRSVLGTRDRDVVGSLGGMKITHKHDGTSPEAESSEAFDPRMTRDRSTAEDTTESEGTGRRDLSELRVYPENRFQSSPRPDLEKANGRDDLQGLKLIMGKSHYFRFEVIRINLVAPRPVNLDDLKVLLVKDNAVYPNVGGDTDTAFKVKDGVIYATVSLGYNPPAGTYQVLVRSKSHPDWPGVSDVFRMVHRRVPAAPKGFSVVNWEYTVPIRNTPIQGPDGKTGDWRMVADWLNFMDTDALWMLVAQTTGWDNSLNKDNPWVKGGFDNLALLAPHLKSNGIQVGAYFMCFFTPENGKRLVGYDPSLQYDPSSDSMYDSRFVSLNSEQRIQDMIKAAREWQANRNVDYIGFDFIRTGEVDGYEMGPEVIDDMNIPVPAGYERWNRLDQVKYFAKRMRVHEDAKTILKWRWWRAHKVATIVNRVLNEGHITKPAWAFTLGWEHGKQHGQDPYMFFDAGLYMDAAMLYEATEAQFRNMMAQWPAYIRDNKYNILIGNSADTRLLDGRSEHPALEYTYRTHVGYRQIAREGLARGIFMHDLSRMFWSTKRGISTLDWAIVCGSTQSDYRRDLGMIPYRLDVAFSRDLRHGTLTVKNLTDRRISGLKLAPVPSPSWAKIADNVPATFSLAAKETVQYQFTADVRGEAAATEAVLGYLMEHKDFRKTFAYGIRSSRDLTPFMSAGLPAETPLAAR